MAGLAILLTATPMRADDTTTVVITTGSTGYHSQSWVYSGAGNPLDTEAIKKHWNEDKYITSAGYTSHGWFFAMNKGVPWTDQFYKLCSDWPDDYIHEKKNLGYMITTLAASDSQWFVVLSKNTGITEQQIASAPWSTLKDWISKWWDKSYEITSIAYRNGQWTVVMSKGTKYTTQAYMWADTATKISDKIKKYWDEGYLVTNLEYGGGEFFCVMSKYYNSANIGQSRFTKSSEDPTSFIKEGWDKGWNITYIGG